MRSIAILSVISVLSLVGCGGNEPEPKTATAEKAEEKAEKKAEKAEEKAEKKEEKAEEKAEKKAEKKEEKAEKKEEKKKSGKEIVLGGGTMTYVFSLADSPDAKKAADEGCAKKAGKDDKKLEACKKEVETTAADEGIRFEKDDKGDWYWVSFGKEKDKEVVYNKVKIKAGEDAPGKLVIMPEGKDSGKKPMKTMPKEMVVEVPDDTTVVIADPKKGKVVYKKK